MHEGYEVDYSFHENVLNKFVSVPPEEWFFLRQQLLVQSFPKGTHLIKEGQVCSTLYYIIKGGARFYYVNHAGDEVTYNFIFENNFAVCFSSLFTQSPTHENIILLEDSIVFALRYNDFQLILSRHPVWEVLLNKLLSKHFIRLCEKEKMLLLDDYNERYKKILLTRPQLFQRVEQRYIASYLKMTPETFSRVKRRVYLSKQVSRVGNSTDGQSRHRYF